MERTRQPDKVVREYISQVLKAYTGYEHPAQEQFIDYCRINPNAVMGSSMAGGNDFSKKKECGAALSWSREPRKEGELGFFYSIWVDTDTVSYQFDIDRTHPFSDETEIITIIR